MACGMLVAQMEPPAGWEREFDDWYETEHIQSRLDIDGFDCATRYRAVEGSPAHLAVYELSDLSAFDSAEYRQLKEHPSPRTERMLANVRGFTRFTCELVTDSGTVESGQYLSMVAFEVPDRDAAAFDDWYETEHVPALLKADDWLRVRRLRVRTGAGGPWTHLALHDLTSLAVMDSPERAAARVGAKRAALAERDWFTRSGRWLYEVVSRHE